MRFRSGLRAFRQPALWFACSLLVAACSVAPASDPKPVSCDATMLGVERTITVTPRTGPIYPLLRDHEVVLTFDDGPDPKRTRAVLDALDKECVKATFFLLGQQASRYPAMVREISARGHSIGSHTWSHANLVNLNDTAAKDQVQRGQEAVNAALSSVDKRSVMFRFPYVATTPDLSQQVRDMGLLEVGVTADGADWTRISPEEAVDLVFQKLALSGNKGVVLLHDPFDRSDVRTALLLSRLKQEGYRIVALQNANSSR